MRTFRSRLQLLLEQNQQLLLRLFRDAERAEAKAARFAPWLQSVAHSGLLPGHIILGDGLLPQSYAPREGGNDSGLYYQAALAVDRGIGVVLWDSEEFCALRRIPEGLEANARLHFQPFAQCQPLLRQWLLPQVDGLVSKLLETIQLDLAASNMWQADLSRSGI